MSTTQLQPAKQKFVTIDEDVAAVLRGRIECEGNNLRITGERLDPTLYKRVDKVLQQLGGKWTAGKVQAHVFPSPPAELVKAALGDGKVLDKKQSYQFFETPADVARQVVELAEIGPSMDVLEPSAGKGALIRAVKESEPSAAVTAVEIDAAHRNALAALVCYARITDFLTVQPRPLFDRVVMNPPFTGGQDADHVMHAFKFLKPGGRLVAIVGSGVYLRTDRKAVAFRAFAGKHVVRMVQLEPGAFRESGTMSATRIVVLERTA